MKNITIFKNEIDLVLSIELKLGKDNLDDTELDFLTKEANNGTPRQMLIMVITFI